MNIIPFRLRLGWQRGGRAVFPAFLGLMLAVFLSGCGQECPVNGQLKFNDLGLPYLLQLTNHADGKIAVEKVVVNGEEHLSQYMVGIFQRGGQLPVELSTGEVASFLVFPYSGKKKIVNVLVVVDGQEWDISFAAY